MVHALRRGQNTSLTRLDPEVTRVEVGVGWELDRPSGALDAEAFAVLVGSDGQVVSDRHLVFYNNRTSPDGAVRLSEPIVGDPGDDRQRLAVELTGMAPEVERIVVAVAVYDDQERTLADARDHYLRVLDAPPDGPVADAGGTELVRYDLDVDLTIETAVVLGEVYRYGEEWKVVAVGHGYASGLRGVATELGVHV